MNDPMQITCPECGAEPGATCSDFGGYTERRRPHPQRIAEAKETFA